MNRNFYTILACVLIFVSCDKTDEPTIKNEIIVKVYNTSTWESSTNTMDPVAGATVYLLSDSETVSALTNDKGIATFNGVKENEYYLVASKGDLSNLIDKSTIDGKTLGYLLIGVYTSQEDILNSPYYSNAVVGGNKFADIFGDGSIKSSDKTEGYYLKFEYQYKDINGDGILDVKDLQNGSLVQLDNQMEVTIFIGK